LNVDFFIIREICLCAEEKVENVETEMIMKMIINHTEVCIRYIYLNHFLKCYLGMGPNRPPDYDVFRERQAKRHRDDPPY
jgi:hypothetical protein